MNLPRASLPVALASAVALGAQIVFSLLLLRLFSPAAVGEFSVVGQVAFFWVTLALSQAHLKLLADAQPDPARALRDNLVASLLRWALLLPAALAAVLLSGLADKAAGLAWAALLALLQLAWQLAQPVTLRRGTIRSVVLVRAAPPLLALAAATLIGLQWPLMGTTGLLLAAALGYALGASWLVRATPVPAQLPAPADDDRAALQADDRTTLLRMVHTGADALTGMAILLAWQRVHGAAEAGYLAILLRVFGFVPAVMHMAWAQVLLADRMQRRAASVFAGVVGLAVTAALSLLAAAAVHSGWVSSSWEPMLPYLLPLVLWQGSACLFGAVSHLPFQQGRARAYSCLSIGFELLQLVALSLPWWSGTPLAASQHIWVLAGVSTAGLLAMSLWLAVQRPG